MGTNQSQIWMLTGERGVGKTTFCRALASHARLAGWNVGGLITSAILTGEGKTGILAENIKTGDTRPLASLNQDPPFNLLVGKWYFDPSIISWGNQVIRDSVPCELLIIDEFGLLEFHLHQGWWGSVDVLQRKEYRVALLVVRPELQETAQGIFNFSDSLLLEDPHNIDPLMHGFWSKISGLETQTS